MHLEDRVAVLESRIAVLEYRAQEQQEKMADVKNHYHAKLQKLEEMLKQLMDDPFGHSKVS